MRVEVVVEGPVSEETGDYRISCWFGVKSLDAIPRN